MEDYVRAAQAEARGLKGIIFTCHCPLPDGLSLQYRMSPEEFPSYVDLVARTREEFADLNDEVLGLGNALSRTRRELADALRQGPLDVELDYPYHPHVTVAHDVEASCLDRAFSELAGFECTFEVEQFHLYVHDEGTGWRPYRDYLLAGAG